MLYTFVSSAHTGSAHHFTAFFVGLCSILDVILASAPCCAAAAIAGFLVDIGMVTATSELRLWSFDVVFSLTFLSSDLQHALPQ